MGDIMLLIERGIATMPFQTPRRRIQDSEARQKVAGGGDGGGEERGTRQERRDQYDVRRKERGERTQKWKETASSKKRGLDCSSRLRGSHLTFTTLALDPSPSAVIN